MAMFGLNLSDHPDARRALVADPTRIPDAIEESLRYNTSAQRFKRCLTQDHTLHGQTMRAGDFVMLCYGSANRDPRKFESPDSYDIARRPKAHLGFGGGVHSCLGAMIARLASQLAYRELLAVVPDYRRVDEQLAWVPSSNFRSPTSLVVAQCAPQSRPDQEGQMATDPRAIIDREPMSRFQWTVVAVMVGLN
eukprot:gene66473-91005_t